MSNYPKFYRQRFILALLKLTNGCLSKMDFQKLLFLSHRETNVHYYDFVPYHFGCYSFQAASDLETLQKLGWLRIQDNNITLLHDPPMGEGLKAEEKNEVISFMRSYQRLRGRKLLRYIYEHYPYYAVRSKMAQDVLGVDAFERVDKIRRNLQNRETVLFTIGYEGKTFEEYVNILLKNDIRLLCDVRKNPISRKHGFSKGALSNLLPKMGIKYQHIPALGIISSSRKYLVEEKDYKFLFEEYKRTLPQKKSYLIELQKMLEVYKRMALTCFEKQPSFCHRHCISDYLSSATSVKVIHL